MSLVLRLLTGLLLIGALGGGAAEATAPRVTLDAGIEGVASSPGDDLVAFKGIPYAASPAGEWRWKPPRGVAPWSGIRPARELGPVWQS